MADENPREGALGVEGTPYFYEQNGVLRRALRLRLPAPLSGTAQVQVTWGAGTADGVCDVRDGHLTALGPPPSAAPLAVEVSVTVAARAWKGDVTLPPARPWTIYVAQDKHLDYGWIHPVEQVVERMNVLTDYHLAASERMGLRWNLDTSIWVEEFMRGRPKARVEHLLSALRSGRFEAGAFWLVPFPGLMSTEELLQSLSYARHLEDALGIPVRTASLQEVPSAPWGLATILAGAGFPYVVKGAYDLRNPHLAERDPLPLFRWAGPDGSRVLVKWDVYAGTHTWGGYAEAYSLWRSASGPGRFRQDATDEERIRLIEQTAARFEGYASYPFDAILLAGTGYDEYPQTTAVSEFIRWFNAQGWAYPRLVDATWSQFWSHIERQRRDGGADVPEVRGDWGSTWEEWPAQLAHLNTVYRRARATVMSAQTLTALAYRFDPDTHNSRAQALGAAWRGLLQFTDHNIGGITPPMADDMRDRKAAYAYTAAREGGRALESGLATLAASMPAAPDAQRRLVVVNPGGWSRAGLVEVMVPDRGPYAVVDPATGDPLPCQLETRGVWPEHYLSFVAPGVPPFGYLAFAVQGAPGAVELPEAAPSTPELENGFYRLAVDPAMGGLRSVWDRVAGRELAEQAGEFSLNQFLHFSDGELRALHVDAITARHGPVSSCLIVEASARGMKLRTTYTLYHTLRRIDIENELTKEATSEPQCSWFLFPFGIPGQRYHYDGPAAILRPGLQADGGDLLPGSGRTCVAVQSFVAASNDDFTVILATPDAHLVQFGRAILGDPTADSDPRQPLVLSTVMHNITRNDSAVDQGGNTHFAFRYILTSHAGPFSSSAALRHGSEAGRPLVAAWATGGEDAPLQQPSGSLFSTEPDNIIVTGLKVAEDGRGWIARLWEPTGAPYPDTEVTLDVRGLGAGQAWRCDLLERDGESLPVEDGRVRIAVPACGLRAVRFI